MYGKGYSWKLLSTIVMDAVRSESADAADLAVRESGWGERTPGFVPVAFQREIDEKDRVPELEDVQWKRVGGLREKIHNAAGYILITAGGLVAPFMSGGCGDPGRAAEPRALEVARAPATPAPETTVPGAVPSRTAQGRGRAGVAGKVERGQERAGITHVARPTGVRGQLDWMEYSVEERKEWVEQFLKLSQAEWEASKDLVLDDARTSRVAEQGALSSKYEKVFPSQVSKSDWTEYGKFCSETGTQRWVLKLRAKMKDGRTMQTKEWYEFSVNKYTVRDDNKVGIVYSTVLDPDVEVSTVALEEGVRDAGYPLDQRGQITLDELVNGAPERVAVRDR